MTITRDGAVQQIAGMLSNHTYHGIVKWRRAVLTFGSSEKPVGHICEQLNLATMSWEELPSMHKSRDFFTPAVWQGAVYLCGGLNNSTIEVYDGHSINLINQKLRNVAGTIACGTSDYLLIITQDSTYYLRKSGESLVLSQTRSSQNIDDPMLYSSVPVLWKDQIIMFAKKPKVSPVSVFRLTE